MRVPITCVKYRKQSEKKIKRTPQFTNLVEGTWEPALRKIMELPVNWMECCEVLVGRTA